MEKEKRKREGGEEKRGREGGREKGKKVGGREALGFLRGLREHNEREWFRENRGRYEEVRGWFVEEVGRLIWQLSEVDSRLRGGGEGMRGGEGWRGGGEGGRNFLGEGMRGGMGGEGVGAKGCIYRINRDIRFSADKTLYKTHLGAYMAEGGRKSCFAGYYLHIEPDKCMLSGGLWMPEPKLLKAVRREIHDRGEEFAAIVEDPSFKQFFPSIEGERLKVMPQGYPKDSPYGEYLRYKSFCVSHEVPDSFFLKARWVDEAVSIFSRLLPFTSFLNEAIDDFFSE
jgi:uncharacterized protein (TIGR02453 family)